MRPRTFTVMKACCLVSKFVIITVLIYVTAFVENYNSLLNANDADDDDDE